MNRRPDRGFLWRLGFQSGSSVTCRFNVWSGILTYVHGHVMKVWEVRCNEGLQKLDLIRLFGSFFVWLYLKFDAAPQILHVACIWAGIPHRSIDCFEMDVNMNFFGVYLRPFGCPYGVTAFTGRSLTACYGGLFSPLWSLCVKVGEKQGTKEGISQYYYIC